MVEVTIPGRGKLSLMHLVCDVNGTLAVDGTLIEGIQEKINNLRDLLEIHLVTANTHGKQDEIDTILELESVILSPGHEAVQKANYVRKLGSENVAAIGQGGNDVEMLKVAKLGICVISPEGTATEALLASDIVVPDIIRGFEIFEKPKRIIADLRK